MKNTYDSMKRRCGSDDDHDAGLPSGNECCSNDGNGRNTTGTRLTTWQFTVFRGMDGNGLGKIIHAISGLNKTGGTL